MKKMILSFFSGYLMLILISSCKGDAGPIGPQGPAGPTGATGATGGTGATCATGSANVIYSNWITVTNSEWSNTGQSATSHTKDLSAPGITVAIVNQGVVPVLYVF